MSDTREARRAALEEQIRALSQERSHAEEPHKALLAKRIEQARRQLKALG